MGGLLYHQRLPIRRHLSVLRPAGSVAAGRGDIENSPPREQRMGPRSAGLQTATGRHGFTAAEPRTLFGSRASFDEAAGGDRMDAETIDDQFSLRMSQSLYEDLHHHLFPGDRDEHGAVIEAGLAVLNRR